MLLSLCECYGNECRENHTLDKDVKENLTYLLPFSDLKNGQWNKDFLIDVKFRENRRN